jgi:hypothetical protein
MRLLPSKLTLDEELPINVRIAVYKKAIKDIETEEYIKYSPVSSLCIILPCILWNLESFNSNQPNGDMWITNETPTAFPELTEEVINKITFYYPSHTKIPIRIKYLKGWIKQLQTIHSVQLRNKAVNKLIDSNRKHKKIEEE